MRKYTKLAAVVLAGAMALSMTACSTASAASMNELVNSSLAAKGSSYAVYNVDATSDETVSLVNEAVATYENYKNSLINTDDYAAKLDDDGDSAGRIESKVAEAKNRNLQTKANFEESLKSFNDRGMGTVYTVTAEQVPQGIENDEAVASYVAGLITGNAKVYISDPVQLPELDDAQGTYTGSYTSLRFVYVQY